MKKLYSLLCAVAVTALAANAATPMVMRSADKVALTPELNTNVIAAKTLDAAPVVKASAKVASAAIAKADAAEYAPKAGAYLWKRSETDGTYCFATTVNLAKVDDANYTIEMPYYAQLAGDKTIAATFAMEELQGYPGYLFPILTIKGGTEYFTRTVRVSETSTETVDLTYKVLFYGYYQGDSQNPAGYYIFDDDLKFIVLDGELMSLYGNGMGILATYNSRYTGWAFETTDFYMPNGNASYKAMDQQGQFTNTTSDIYALFDTEKKSIQIIGFDNWGAIDFNYNDALTQAVTTGDPIYKFFNPGDDDAAMNDETVYEAYLSVIEDQQMYVQLIYTLEEEGGKAYLVFDPQCRVFANYNTDFGGSYAAYSDIEIEMPSLKDAIAAGVEDIVAGEAVDADAPVEYFNLQGQRVAEPAAGLYIKRQGKTVSKVVIR